MAASNFTEADGRQLAVDLLRELDQWAGEVDDRVLAGPDDDLPPDMRELKLNEDPEILRRYLATVRGAKSPALERGFLALLTDVLTQEGSIDFDRCDDYTTPRPGLKFSTTIGDQEDRHGDQ